METSSILPESTTETYFHEHLLSPDNLIFTSVSLGTVIVLCALKASVFTFLKRRYKDHTVTCMECTLEPDNGQPCPCLKYDRLPWYYSDLYCDVVSCICLLVMGLYALTSAAVIVSPFVGKYSFDNTKVVLSIATGNQCYRLIRLAVGPHVQFRCKLSHMHITVAIFAYVTMFITRENAVLGAVGAVTQSSTLFYTIRCIVISGTSGFLIEVPRSVHVAVFMRILATIVFSLLLPILYLSFALATQSPLVMTHYNIGVFSFTVSFFGVANITELIMAMSEGCKDTGFFHFPENSCLLHKHHKPSRYYSNIISASKQTTAQKADTKSDKEKLISTIVII